MTNKEVINFMGQIRAILLADKSWLESTREPINEAFDLAISALRAQELNETQKPLDTISKQAAIDAVLKLTYADGAYGYADAKELVDMLEALPSAEPEQRTGEWHVLDECANEGIYCSRCQKKVFRLDFSNTMKQRNYKFCPNCGSRNEWRVADDGTDNRR